MEDLHVPGTFKPRGTEFHSPMAVVLKNAFHVPRYVTSSNFHGNVTKRVPILSLWNVTQRNDRICPKFSLHSVTNRYRIFKAFLGHISWYQSQWTIFMVKVVVICEKMFLCWSEILHQTFLLLLIPSIVTNPLISLILFHSWHWNETERERN